MSNFADLSSWHVLIVDDEPDSLQLISDMLVLNDAEVFSAHNGSEALAILAEKTPTFVILDLSMPSPNGWELLSAIRSRAETAALPVIAVTAFYSDKVIDEARKAGFNALLPKPIKLGSLLSKLQEVAGE